MPVRDAWVVVRVCVEGFCQVVAVRDLANLRFRRGDHSWVPVAGAFCCPEVFASQFGFGSFPVQMPVALAAEKFRSMRCERPVVDLIHRYRKQHPDVVRDALVVWANALKD